MRNHALVASAISMALLLPSQSADSTKTYIGPWRQTYMGTTPESYHTIYPSGSSASQYVGFAIAIPRDNLNDEGEGKSNFAYNFVVNSPNFGGPTARGGRINFGSQLAQTSPADTKGILHDYIASYTAVGSSSGDAGQEGSERGNYYGLWNVNAFGPKAQHLSSVQGMEIDLALAAGGSTANKTGLLIGHSSGAFGLDAVSGSKNDNLIWLTGSQGTIASRIGLQFGRDDIPGVNYGAKTLIGTVGEFETAATGIDFTSAVFQYAWKSKGATIDGRGNGAFTALRTTLKTPSSSRAPCATGEFADDIDFHYVCVAPSKWKRVALENF